MRNVQILSGYWRYWLRSSKYDKWVPGTRTFPLNHLLHSEMTAPWKNWSIRDLHQTLWQITFMKLSTNLLSRAEIFLTDLEIPMRMKKTHYMYLFLAFIVIDHYYRKNSVLPCTMHCYYQHVLFNFWGEFVSNWSLSLFKILLHFQCFGNDHWLEWDVLYKISISLEKQ